jgi:acetyl-CoA synthetase
MLDRHRYVSVTCELQEESYVMSIDLSGSLAQCGFAQHADGWSIPISPLYNIGQQTVGRRAAQDSLAPALVFEDADGSVQQWNFTELDRWATRFAVRLAELGIGRGDPVGVHTGQRPETAVTHLALYKLGAVAVTMSQLYGPETIAHILSDSGLRIVVSEDGAWPSIRTITPRDIQTLEKGDDPVGFQPVETRADEPALLMYTSGSTGRPKGLLHAHRILEAYMPTVRMFYDLSMDDADAVFWTPADWAWVGGLLDLVLPAWVAGRPVIASQHRFDTDWAFAFMSRHKVTHSFMTPTALKRLAEAANPRARWPLHLRVICTGGESLPGEVIRWAENELGVTCNEFYGLTEFNHLVGNCRRLYPIRPGSMGRAYPGHGTTLVDPAGQPVPIGEVGEIVAPADDPTLFLGYWRAGGSPLGFAEDGWLRTGDLARCDADGYFWYQGRNDDLIKSAGYRIGPAEVEDSLVAHPYVAEAAVVASPDAVRGSIVKAFVRLANGVAPSEAVVRALQDHVKINLAAYKYPREIEFVSAFPLTSSGKIRRGELRRMEVERKSHGRV